MKTRRPAALLAALAALGLLVAASGAGGPVTPADVRGPMAWGAARNVTSVGRLYFAGQPDRAGLEAARAAGVAVVVNLRAPGELDWDEQAAVEALGMRYYNVPVEPGKPFSRAAFSRVDEIVAAHPSDEIFVHCSSSNRAGAWFAAYLVDHRGMSVDEALAVGRKTGITKPKIERGVRALLAEESG